MIEVCPLCGDADDVQRVDRPSGDRGFVCTRRRGHPAEEPYRWAASCDLGATMQTPGRAGAGDRGLADALFACVLPGEPWAEYGIVEHRYAERHPDAFRRLVAEKGHRWRDTDTGPAGTDTTASKYLVRTLSALAKVGELSRQFGAGTGVWRYNSRISYWVRPPEPPTGDVLSYAEFAHREGFPASS
jgi:hypothetical protein